jgi:hypothetical protein
MTEKKRDAHMATLSSLVAAVSILEEAQRIHKKPSMACASDAMFREMIKDYKRAIDDSRAILSQSQKGK